MKGDLPLVVERPHYQVTKYRYVVSICFFLSMVICSMMLTSFNPIIDEVRQIYPEVSLFMVTFCTSLISPALFPFMNFVANYVNDEIGIKLGMAIANLMMICGLVLRLFFNNGFIFVFLGQAATAVATPFLMNTPQKISGSWFPENERGFATTCLSLANFAGMAVGFVMPSFFMKVKNAEVPTLESEISSFVTFQAISCIPILVLSTFLFQSKPKHVPNAAARMKKYNYKQSLQILCKQNSNFLLFGVSTGLLWGTFAAAGSVLNPLITPAGYTTQDLSMFGGSLIGCGLIGGMILGRYANKTKAFKKISIILIVIASVLIAILIPCTTNYQPLISELGLSAYGFVTMPLFAIAYEYSIELTFPVAEATAAGVMTTCTQIFHVTLTFIIDQLIDLETNLGTLLGAGVLVIANLLGLLGQIITKQELRRQDAEISIESDNATDTDAPVA